MKKFLNFKRLAIGLVVLALCLGAYFYFSGQKQDAGQKAVNTATVTRGTVEAVVTAQGKLEPKDYVDVGAEVSGQIKKLHVDIGDVVKKDTLLADIDPANYEAAVKGDDARIQQLSAQIAQQEANVEQARQKLERNKKLFESKAASQEVFQDAQTALKIANAQLLSLEAQMMEAQSVLEGDQADLERTKIYAPMDGTVVSLSVKEGQTINANQTAPIIAQIAQLGIMTARAQVAEADITKLKPDMPVYFTTLGNQGRKWQGHIRQILPSPETINDVVLYNVLSDVENTDGQLMTGMTTQLFFVLGRAENTLTIPASALIKRAVDADTTEARAYSIDVMQGKKVTTKTVLIGLTDRTSAQVISGLEEGDIIILSTPNAAAAGNTAPGGARRMRL